MIITENIADLGDALSMQSSSITRDTKTGLLRIDCKHAARPEMEMTPEQVAELLFEQEASWAQNQYRDLKPHPSSVKSAPHQ